MDVVILGLVILALLVYIAWVQKQYHDSLQELIRLTKAKTVEDVGFLQTLKQSDPQPEPPLPPIREYSDLSDEEFKTVIQKHG